MSRTSIPRGTQVRLGRDCNLAVKRALDVTLSLLGLLVISPLLAGLAILISLDSAGPILYRRPVVGVGGKQFHALKLRTMVVNADQVLRDHPDLWAEYQKNVKLKNDPRVTRVGRSLRRLSLDELPQLFNVVRGEMSLVGPRMIAPEELPKYGEFGAKRLCVKPGITGLWQVSGRQDVSYKTRIKLDMQYIENWSLWLDFEILLRTLPAVLKMRGAY